MRLVALARFAFAFALALAASGDSESDCPRGCVCLGSVADCEVAPDRLPRWMLEVRLNGARPPPEWPPPDEPPPSIVALEISRAKLVAVPRLAGLPALRRLSLPRNELVASELGALAGAPALRELDLQRNAIDSAGGAIPPLAELRALRLTANAATRLPRDSFAGLVALERLELDRNAIREIDGFAFKDLARLRTLDLRRNEIERLNAGAFYGLSSIETLRLDRNRLARVSKDWTFGLESAKNLTLTRNRIESLEPGCWEGLGRLERLALSGNRLRAISQRSFEHLSALRSLDLDSNGVSTLAVDAFARVPRLERLDLSRNEISWAVEDGAAPFAGPRALRELSLESNEIKSIGERAFDGLESLARLDLGGNEVAFLHRRSFEPLRALERLRLDSSALVCDCALRWLPARVAELDPSSSVRARCAYPERLRGEDATSLDGDAFACEEDSPKPRVVEHPQRVVGVRGGDAKMRCAAASAGDAELRFVWRRNDVNLTSARTSSSLSNATGARVAASELTLVGLSERDAGKYKCVASNAFGSAFSRGAQLDVFAFPAFAKRPKDATVRVGDTAKLECSAVGEPTPQIAWQKDEGVDFPAARERRMHVIPADDTFFIVNSQPADAGVYACTATNPAGSISSNATLVVLEKPSFANAMENEEVVAGETAVIECRASGAPKPKLRWLKDGAPIVASERHFFTAENQLLVVVNAQPSDEGRYECEIENELGSATDSTELRVLPPNALADDDTTGIVVITVVCCAVGTSVVWVVIIYQTRKRMKRAVVRLAPDSLGLATLSIETGSHRHRHHHHDDRSLDCSSCKDSGTGDSADKDATPIRTAVVVYENPGEEARSLLDRQTVACYVEVCPDSPDRTYAYS